MLAGGEAGPAAPSVDPTWGRVAGDVRRGRARRRWISVVALQLAIGLGGMGVWAAVTGRLPRMTAKPAPTAPTPCEKVSPLRPFRASSWTLPADESPPLAAPAPAADTGPGRSAHERAAFGRTTTAPHAADVRAPLAATVVETAPLTPEAPAAEALYRRAHELHFVRRDFAAALPAWDRYLAGDPKPLALEGRWNRAIALVHLGRREEAMGALRPFADATAGAYRQQEARALIDKLQRED